MAPGITHVSPTEGPSYQNMLQYTNPQPWNAIFCLRTRTHLTYQHVILHTILVFTNMHGGNMLHVMLHLTHRGLCIHTCSHYPECKQT